MISTHDVVSIEITPEELEYCKQHPATGCTKSSTGQLKAVGNMVLCKLLGLTQEQFDQQAEAADEMGASYVCEVQGRQLVGISPTVSVIRDDDALQKRVIVPASQLFRSAGMAQHYTVGVMIKGTTNAQKEPVTIDKAYAVGYIPTKQLKRWVRQGGVPPFTVEKGSQAVAPCGVLFPMRRLLNEVRWQQYCK